jgi:hypothetical protein
VIYDLAYWMSVLVHEVEHLCAKLKLTPVEVHIGCSYVQCIQTNQAMLGLVILDILDYSYQVYCRECRHPFQTKSRPVARGGSEAPPHLEASSTCLKTLKINETF